MKATISGPAYINLFFLCSYIFYIVPAYLQTK